METNEVRALRSAALPTDTVPARILLAPWGLVESTSGEFVVDEESATLTVQAFDEHATDLPIDYEHQTLGGQFASPSGQAPAAGWIKRLVAEPGVGLLADIEWTDQARKMLTAKEYRYLSPVAVVRKSDRKLVAIHSAALTNKPAIVGMQPIVNHHGVPQVDTHSDEDESLCVLRTELRLPAEADSEEVLATAGRRLVELREVVNARRAEERIVEAMRVGKLVAAQRPWAEALIARDESLFEEWIATAPVIVRPGATVAPHAGDARE
ncbi:MAG: phage protease, partial [Phycisphaerales bacterium]|nr:phage protease [Phycisphaerales bacterium]